MTDGRARRVAFLATAGKAKSEAKTKDAKKAIRSLVISIAVLYESSSTSMALKSYSGRGRLSCLHPLPCHCMAGMSADT